MSNLDKVAITARPALLSPLAKVRRDDKGACKKLEEIYLDLSKKGSPVVVIKDNDYYTLYSV